MAIVDVVKWNAAPNVFAWKFPSSELSTSTQLIVAESQEAVLMREGSLVGPFGAGRHTLSTANYPVLTSLIKTVTGGATPFSAEVWFIQKSFNLNIKWGTVGALQLEDPKYHIMLPVRAFGQYGIVVEDSAKFLLKLVGTMPCFVERTLCEYFKGVLLARVKDLIAKYLVEKNVSVLQISANLFEISQSIQSDFAKELEDYGLRLVNFNITGINTDEQDSAVKQLKAALAKKAEMDIIGYTYQQEKSFDTMKTAAGNAGAGNVLSAGLGMGMGMGMGVPMGGVMGGMAQELRFANDKPKDEQIKCHRCGAKVAGGMKFCPECGHKMTLECPSCRKAVGNGAKFCPECGTKIG